MISKTSKLAAGIDPDCVLDSVRLDCQVAGHTQEQASAVLSDVSAVVRQLDAQGRNVMETGGQFSATRALSSDAGIITIRAEYVSKLPGILSRFSRFLGLRRS